MTSGQGMDQIYSNKEPRVLEPALGLIGIKGFSIGHQIQISCTQKATKSRLFVDQNTTTLKNSDYQSTPDLTEWTGQRSPITKKTESEFCCLEGSCQC